MQKRGHKPPFFDNILNIEIKLKKPTAVSRKERHTVSI